MSEISKNVSRNLSALRKARGLTQGQLAEEFSYSDKSISKWETGEGLPDINVLADLAKFYGVTLDYLITEHHDEELENKGRRNPRDIERNKVIIISLAVVFVWTVAAVVYAALKLSNINAWKPWLCFIWAIPFSFQVLIYFSRKWRNPLRTIAYFIAFFWAMGLAIYLELGIDLEIGWHLWFIWLIPIPATIGTIFFYRYSKEKDDIPFS